MRRLLPIAACLSLFCVASATGEEFLLSSGGTVRGRWLNRGDRPLKVYVIEMDHGGRLSLAPNLVIETVRLEPSQAEYERISPNYADTVASQWELAQWCRQHRLRKQRQAHLRRVIELDPDHVLARRALGYGQLHGRWARQHEVLAEQGYVHFAGRWRVQQQVDLLKESQRVKQAERRWFLDTKRWRSQLSTDFGARAVANFQAVRDPHAIAALARLLEGENDRNIRLMYIGVLGRIDHNRSTSLLVDMALSELDEEVFHACVDQLLQRDAPPLIRVFAEALHDQDNRRVNRAGYLLGRLQDEQAIEPLIDALITTHMVTLSDPSGRAPGATTTGFIRRDDNEFGNYFAVRNGPQMREIHKPNQGVLAGLEELAGLSFGFDQRAWRHWFTLNRRTQTTPSLSRGAS